VNLANLIGPELLAQVLDRIDRQPGDAMALKEAVQGTATEVWDRIPHRPQHVIQRQ
jgi:hypothetical protein